MTKHKLMTSAFLLTGICLFAGTGTALADTPDDLWEYTYSTDSDSNIVYDFKEVEVTLPSDWAGKCGMIINDANVTFYHLGSYQAYKDEGTVGGRLFTLAYSQDYRFTDTDPSYSIIGSAESGIYYLSMPTDVQGYLNDQSIYDEWKSLADDVSWVEDHIKITHPVADIVDVDQIASTVSDTAVEGYIVPDSSSKVLSASDLKDLNAGQLQMAINEIYARHHRRFATASIQDYFDSRSWYSGTIDASSFDSSVLSDTEWANITLMLSLMNSMTGSSTAASSQNDVTVIGGTQTTVETEPAAPIVSSSATGSNLLYTNADVNMRAQAVSGSTIVAVVLKGLAVNVTGETVNGWVPVTAGGISGYIYQDYLVSARTSSAGSDTTSDIVINP